MTSLAHSPSERGLGWGLRFHGAGGEAANQIPLKQDEDDHHWKRGERRHGEEAAVVGPETDRCRPPTQWLAPACCRR